MIGYCGFSDLFLTALSHVRLTLMAGTLGCAMSVVQ